MWIRILKEVLRRHPRRVGVTVLAVAVGAALVSALLGISLDITGKMAREMRSYGANILITPRGAGMQLEIGGITINPLTALGGIDENELIKLKTIFWKHNILGFAPFLSTVVQVEGGQAVLTGTWFDKPLALPKGVTVRTGIRTISPWWQVKGNWADDDAFQEAMVGTRIAQRLSLRPGQVFTVRRDGREQTLQVIGLITTGGDEEDQIFVPLPSAQALLGIKKGADKVLVSALVEPEDKLRSDLRGLDPSEMTSEQYATWYCSPIIGAVITQIEEILPVTRARPILQISEAEGAFLTKIGLLLLLLTITTLAAAALAVMAVMTAAVLERRAEIGLMKAIGADGRQIALIFLSQAGFIGLAGGLLGYLAGLGLAAFIGQRVFAATVSLPPLVLPVTVVLALGVALAGSALPVRRAMQFEPAILLGEGR